MQLIRDDETISQLWDDFFQRDAKRVQSIVDMSDAYGVIQLEYSELMKHSIDLAEWIIDNPSHTLAIGESSILSALGPDQKLNVEIQIINIPECLTRKVEDIGVEDLEKLRYSVVRVVRRKQNQAKVNIGAFRCTSCGFVQEILQDKFNFTEPLECNKEDGGCGKRASSTTFKFLLENSTMIDSQYLYIQDEFDKTVRIRPDRLKTYLEGKHLVNKIEMGEKVGITYIVKAKQEDRISNKMNYLLECISFTKIDEDITEDLTEEDIEAFQKMKKDIFNLSIKSIAPHIYGYDVIKLSLFLQYIGAPAPSINSDIKERSDFHILLFGDPGTGKSQLIMDMCRIWHKSFFSGAKNCTSAGLTVAVVPDEFSKGYVLEAGVLVLANNGLAGIDELDKADPKDRGALHMVMEQQIIPVNKAGINAEIPSAPTLLCAANPKNDLYESLSIHDQSYLEDTLLQRFALKWKIKETDNHEAIKNRTTHSILARSSDSIVGERAISIHQMRKYRKYAQDINPTISEEILNYIQDRFLTIHNRNQYSGGLNEKITQRVFNDIERLCKASARARLSASVDKDDVDLAVWIYQRSLDIIESGVNDSISIELTNYSFEPTQITFEEIQNMIVLYDSGNGADISKLEQHAEKKNLYGLQEHFDMMFKNGMIIYPKSGRVKLNSSGGR